MTAALPQADAVPAAAVTSETDGNLFTRGDTMFGVCQGIGEDMGINPLWIRLGFIAPLFFFPVWTIAAYFVLGAVVLVSRLAIPVSVKEAAAPAASATAPVLSVNDVEEVALAA